jgi:hypothetical protein
MAGEVDITLLPPAAGVRVDFQKDIQPILDRTCWRCHGAERPKGGFRLDNRESALKGGDGGVAIVAGDSAKSPLIQYVARLVPDMEMPPEGKGEPLTAGEVGLLRAWIDQGVPWSTNTLSQLAFSAATTVGFIGVDGDHHKFREVEGVREGFRAGLESFYLREQTGPDQRFTAEGRALFPDDDIRLKLNLERTGVGFIQFNFEQWRKYYDDTGGYYRPFPVPSYDLDRDLHLNLGRVSLDIGLARPRGPKIVLGYEYQYRKGEKSLLEWGSAYGKNIYPAAEEVDEDTHIFKFDLNYDARDWRIEDRARVEIYDLGTSRESGVVSPPGWSPTTLVRTGQKAGHVQGMNTLTIERRVADWWLLSGGYLYSRLEGDFSFDQVTTDTSGFPAPGRFWSGEVFELEREAHILDLSSQLLPAPKLSLSAGLQSGWQRQHAFGDIHLDEGDPDLPDLFLLQPATVESGLDKWTLMEHAVMRYTGLPYTVLFAEGRLRQESLSQFERENGDVSEAFLRDTDAANHQEDLRGGFHVSPWRWAGWSAHYRYRNSDTDYDHYRRFMLTGNGYSAFIDHRAVQSDEVETKLALRPASWVRVNLSYRRAWSDYLTSTEPVPGDISPGGGILAGTYLADTYGIGATLSPFPRLRLSGTFTYSDARTATADHDSVSVIPYHGDIISFIMNVNYAWTTNREVYAGYAFSRADYGRNDAAEGLPLGLDYQRHGVTVGLRERLGARVTAGLRYRFYYYSEPGAGGFNDYTAHGVFATLSYKWL